jgi:signal transduction histidine kinase
MSLLMITAAATWLTAFQLAGWAPMVAIPCAGLAVIVGAAAVVTFGRWVDSARERILRDHRSSEELARLREADRIARDLGSTTVSDLFGISMALQSAAARHPSAAPALRVVTADLDRVLRDIRTHVFNREHSLAEVLTELDPELAASPRVDGDTDVLAPVTLESFLREALPQFPSAVLITVTSAAGELRVTITGVPPEDPTTLKETAADHDATTTYEPDHVVIEWVTRQA